MKGRGTGASHPHRREFLLTSGGLLSGGLALVAVPSTQLYSDEAARDTFCQPHDTTQPRVQDDSEVIHDPRRHASELMRGFPPPKNQRVTFDNWFDSTARIRWTHLNSEFVFKSIVISRGDSPVWVLPRKMLDHRRLLEAQVKYGLPASDAKEISVEEWFRRSDTDAFLVLRDGHIVFELYFGDMTPQTRHHIWCGPKTILTTIMAPFIFGGEIPLDTNASRYVPEFKGTGFEDAIVHQLLNQTTSLDYYPDFPEGDPRWDSPEWQYNYGSPKFRRARHLLAQDLRIQGTFPLLPGEEETGLYDFVTTLRKGKRDHGETWSYNDSNSTALQWILERHTGHSYFEHLRNLWHTLGTEQGVTVAYDAAGTASLPAGTSVTARDYARWGQMVLNRGGVGSGQEIPGIRELVRHIEHNPVPLGWDGYLTGNHGYQMHFWTDSTQNGKTTILRARGAYHNSCTVDLERNTVVVQFASYWDRDPEKVSKGLRENEHVDSNENALIDFVTRVLPHLVD